MGVLHWEGFGRVLGGRWRVVRVGSGSLIYRQIKWLHCSGYLLVDRYVDEIRIRSSFFTLYYGYMPHRMASLTEWPNL